MDACFIFLEADLMSADSSRFQSEADNVIRKYFENENELLDVKPEHGILLKSKIYECRKAFQSEDHAR